LYVFCNLILLNSFVFSFDWNKKSYFIEATCLV
jgi:hypothetical protein